MVSNLDLVDTIVIVMLENRSFDHVMGYLNLPGQGRIDVEGLSSDPAWLANHANRLNGASYAPFHMTEMVIPDPPHEQATMEIQIGARRPDGTNPLDGFVKSYMERDPRPADPSLVMGYYTGNEVPIFDFLAREFAICDHWFASLPTGTQPNRLMAMSGTTRITDNAPNLLPDQKLVYEWLDDLQVAWRVYHRGRLPFFSLMPDWSARIAKDIALETLGISGQFRGFDHFTTDWDDPAELPPVIFIEPDYTDGPKINPNDDHPPTPISAGQAFVRQIYSVLIANPKRWQRTMMIVTYDEHGGFYDHVSPLAIPMRVTTQEGFPIDFESTGLRVPAFVVSPLVKSGSVYRDPLDHTSILQLIADKFHGGKPYSADTEPRQSYLSSLSSVLNLSTPRTDVPSPPASPVGPLIASTKSPGQLSPATGASKNSDAFQLAAAKMVREHPELIEHGLGQIAEAYKQQRATIA